MATVADPASWLPRAVAIRRAMAGRTPDDVVVRRELAICLLQTGQGTGDASAFHEGATLLVALHKAGTLEAQYRDMARALAEAFR